MNSLISYNIDDNGTLFVYINNILKVEISDCGLMSQDKIEELISELLFESGEEL